MHTVGLLHPWIPKRGLKIVFSVPSGGYETRGFRGPIVCARTVHTRAEKGTCRKCLIHVHLCNRHPDRDRTPQAPERRILLPSRCLLPLAPPRGNHYPDFLQHKLVLPVLMFYRYKTVCSLLQFHF